MAPEQFSGAPIDERTDLFAAGVIFYEMLTGVKPFRGKSVTEIMSLMETRGPEDIGAFNPAVPDQLRQVIAKALAFDPSSRFSDAGAFAKAVADAFPNRTGQLAEAATASFVQTTSTPAAGEIALVDASPDPENLARIERELATFIGPVASIAVKRASTQTHNLEILYDLLAMYIDNHRDRAEFLKLARRGGAGGSDLPPASVSVERHPTREQTQIVAKAPSPSAISAIEMSLTQYLGPIAKLLVRRELQKFETMESFCRVLAVHIPDEGEREAFLRTARQHLAARA
jgi:serine/threonine-protein kinase